jgi:hypothetical protein
MTEKETHAIMGNKKHAPIVFQGDTKPPATAAAL